MLALKYMLIAAGVMLPAAVFVLKESEVERIGGDRPVAVDVRALVTTHRNLEGMVEAGSFRRDIYHRVLVFPIMLPPLRERREDIPVLVEYFSR